MPKMLAYIPYMDPMGDFSHENSHVWSTLSPPGQRGLIHQLQIGGLFHEVHKVVRQRDENFINLPGFQWSRYNEKNTMGFSIEVFPKWGTPKSMVYNIIRENPIKMDDLGVPPFQETPTCTPQIRLGWKLAR